MKFGKIDIVFVVVYLIILILLLIIVPLTISWIGPSPTKYDIIWSNVLGILLYAIVVPIIYFGMRWYLQKKK